MIKKMYLHMKTDLKNVVTDEDLRWQIQYRYILIILALVVCVTGMLNLLSERYTMGVLMLLLAVTYLGLFFVVYYGKTRGVRIVNVMMMISTLVMDITFLIHGTTGGVAPIWTLLFPILSCLLLGRNLGMANSALLLTASICLFWTPMGRGLLLHNYDPVFLQRYPLIFMTMMVISFFYETLRSSMVEQLKEERQMMETVYQNQFHSLDNKIAEARKVRHDTRHHLVLIHQFLNDNKVEEAKAYVEQYAQMLPFEEALTYCEHYATNALLTYYAYQTKNNDIPMDVRINLPPELPFLANDLTIVFGNLLENALQACVNGREEDSHFQTRIAVRSSYNGSALAVTIENTALHEAVPDKNKTMRYVSTKHNGYGIGIQSVNYVVKKYNGSFQIDQSEGMFRVNLVMYAVG